MVLISDERMANHLATTELYELLHSQAHVWYCQPNDIQDASKLSAYKAMLSAQEIKQYHRFRAEEDKHCYLVSHALLRSVLSKYVVKSESQWQFIIGEHGKPELDEYEARGLCFNLTHTKGLSACVVTVNRRCGIDVESIDRKNKLSAVAKRMFAKEELEKISEKDANTQFYHYWTLREAYLKAIGAGLAASSKDFFFEVNTQTLRASIHYRKDSKENNIGWQFQLGSIMSKHMLAVAIEASAAVEIVTAEMIP